MNKYNKELDQIKANEEFKRRTKALLIEELKKNNANEIQSNPKELEKTMKIGTDRNKKSLAIAAALLAIVIGGTFAVKYTLMEKALVERPVNSEEDNNQPQENTNQGESNNKINNQDSNETTTPSDFTPREDLPALAMDYSTTNGSMGFAALMAYDIKDLENGGPSIECTGLNHLPAFENLGRIDEKGNPTGDLAMSKDAMKEIAKDMASKLGYTIETFEEYNESISAKGAEVEILVTSNGSIEIYFLTLIKLPENIPFGYGDKLKNLDEANAATEYLIESYKEVLGLKSPALASTGDYAFDGKTRTWNYSCYEDDGDLTSDILNYNFRKVEFCPDDFGNLMLLRISNRDLSKEIGDYPIISKAEAVSLLIKGNYLTTVPEAFPGEEYIKKVEIAYNKDAFNKSLMPFYRFYVEVPALEEPNGLKTFGIYDVPAIQGKYLKDLPKAEVQFN